MAAETLYREGRLSVSAIGKKLHISKSTLYRYLRHRGIKIGSSAKISQHLAITAQAVMDDAERIATVILRLAIMNNSKFVRGKKRTKENIERYCLEPYCMKPLEPGNYALSIPYRNDEALDKTVHDLLTEISQEAETRNCFIEADVWEEGTERRW
jgi:AcrR family transcriptional regulator